MLSSDYVIFIANLRSVLRINVANSPKDEITISSKHTLIKRIAWAMLILFQERAVYKGMQLRKVIKSVSFY